jgi:hypothetical protein
MSTPLLMSALRSFEVGRKRTKELLKPSKAKKEIMYVAVIRVVPIPISLVEYRWAHSSQKMNPRVPWVNVARTIQSAFPTR